MRYVLALAAILIVANLESIARSVGGSARLSSDGRHSVGACGRTTGTVLDSRATTTMAVKARPVLAPVSRAALVEPQPIRPVRTASVEVQARPPVLLSTAGLQLASTDTRYIGPSGRGGGGQYYNNSGGRGGRGGRGGGLFGRGRR